MPNKVGRPSDFTPELGKLICERIAAGESLRKICRDDDMPSRISVHSWLLDIDKLEFLNQYKASCDIRAENMFDELTEIADDGQNDFMEIEREDGSTFTKVNTEHIQRSRLRTDVRKWYLSKVMPKKFGDKLDITTKDKPIVAVITGMVVQKEPEDDEPDADSIQDTESKTA